jgi:hypothetical protein
VFLNIIKIYRLMDEKSHFLNKLRRNIVVIVALNFVYKGDVQ